MSFADGLVNEGVGRNSFMREIDTWIDWSAVGKLLDRIYGSKGLARDRCEPANEPRERPAAITAEYAANKAARSAAPTNENHATQAHAKKLPLFEVSGR